MEQKNWSVAQLERKRESLSPRPTPNSSEKRRSTQPCNSPLFFFFLFLISPPFSSLFLFLTLIYLSSIISYQQEPSTCFFSSSCPSPLPSTPHSHTVSAQTHSLAPPCCVNHHSDRTTVDLLITVFLPSPFEHSRLASEG